MVIIGLDLETTGLSYENGHRIIEVGMIKQELDLYSHKARTVGHYIQRIHPNRTVPADAVAIHGITLSDLVGCPQFHAVAADVVDFMSDARLLVGHNLISFDGPFLAMELMAAGQKPPSHVRMFDTIEARWATPHGKLPSLGELCYALEIPYDSKAAHSAEYDIARTLEAFQKGLELGWFKIPEST